MDKANEILEVIGEKDSLIDQLTCILKFILNTLTLTQGYIATVHCKKRLITIDNPKGYYYKMLIGIETQELRNEDVFEHAVQNYNDYSIIPIVYKETFLGQICLVGPAIRIESLKYLFQIIGRIVYFNKIGDERDQLLEEKELTKAKSMFMANISHEIRTPLNAIIGCLDYFQELDLSRPGKEVVEVMKKSSFNLLYLVNDILDISGLESNKMTIHLAPTKLNDIVADAYKITVESKSTGVSFQSHISVDIPSMVVTDSQRVKQIIINLMSNAFKFTKAGHVKLKLTLATKEDLEALDLQPIETISLTPHGSPKNEITKHYSYRKNSVEQIRRGKKMYIKVAVSDTGIGIKETDIEKLFKSFSQIDSSTTKQYAGTGLGLAISAGFCKLLQGGISLISEWNKGSTFYFVIPIQEYKNVAEKTIDLSLLKGKYALIVDDKVDNIVRLTNILDKYEINYESTTSAKHAIASFVNNKRYTFDFGLIDVYMPEMDGNQLAEYISKTEKQFPLIALSSGDTKLNDITGCFDITLTKPYSEDQVIQCIYNTLTIHVSKDKPRLLNKKSSIHKSKSKSKNIIHTNSVDSISSSSKSSSSNKESKRSEAKKESKPSEAKKESKPSESKPSPHRKSSRDSSSLSSSSFKANTNIEIKILVVEDNEYNQFTIKRMLNSLGYYNVDMASSGYEAIAKIQNNRDVPLTRDGDVYADLSAYDVILMDVIMPDMDGITTSRKIKRMFKSGKAPKILAVTANVMPGSAEKCIRHGKMDGFIEKPIDKSILAEHLSEIETTSKK
jgi:signal transduction histidine kinase/DNA-binding response OmpR family regulator